MTTPQVIVNIEHITKKFPGGSRTSPVVALEDINLGIIQGQFLALLGPSGCGKTTLLRILGGLEVPTTGRAVIDGQDMTGVPPEKRPVNMVFQSPALFPHRNVFENISFGPRMAGVPADKIAPRIKEMLSLVRLEGYEDRRVTQLSGGQSQRVALARALINSPKVLLLDEPLSALDLKLRRAMQLELKRIHRMLDTTFVYVTHDQEEAITMADRIVVMNQGHVVQDGAPHEIYQRPSTKFAADFIGESNLLPARVCQRDRLGVIAEIEGGLLVQAISQQELSDGQKIWISIRPENICLGVGSAAVPSGMNQFAGEVGEVLFLGAFVRYEVKLAGGQHLMALEDFRNNQSLLQPGDAVYVGWKREQCLALAE